MSNSSTASKTKIVSSALSRPDYLSRCQRLEIPDVWDHLEVGARLARGFADLGIEEFSLLPGNQIVSLFTGQKSTIQDHDRRHFFSIPTPRQLVEAIQSAGWDIRSLSYEDQRVWRISARQLSSGQEISVRAPTIESVLLDTYLLSIEQNEKRAFEGPFAIREGAHIILASSSPRRRELLQEAGVSFQIEVSACDETPDPNESADEMVARLSRNKALAVATRFPDSFVIGADTTVVLSGEVLGKPQDREDAFHMLRKLQGTTHEVLGGITVLNYGKQNEITRTCSTKVTMSALSESQIRRYVETGEPLDKAGSYAVQGIGSSFIAAISGSYTNVVGLDIVALLEMLARAGALEQL